jgi:hypothetical protein
MPNIFDNITNKPGMRFVSEMATIIRRMDNTKTNDPRVLSSGRASGSDKAPTGPGPSDYDVRMGDSNPTIFSKPSNWSDAQWANYRSATQNRDGNRD